MVSRQGCAQETVSEKHSVANAKAGRSARGSFCTLRRRCSRFGGTAPFGGASVLCDGAQALGCIDVGIFLALPLLLGTSQLTSLNFLCCVKWGLDFAHGS